MGQLALVIALVGIICAVLPAPGMFLGLGLGIFALGLGIAAYRRPESRAWSRLSGAGAVTVAVLAVLISGIRYALTLAAIDRIENMF